MSSILGIADRSEWNGHWGRIEDLERFAALGLKTLRYPILWEHVAPHHPDQFDWTWADQRLGRLKELGIRPIVGLLHHGSGPRYTSLIDPEFPEKLARYARQVAQRYPWIDAYTPVNEPLTTARFSGLYGYWYPHGRGTRCFLRALINQCRGIVLAMKTIREINPRAELIQTEDLGKIESTPFLAYQADYENERRFLSMDLLCGRVGPDHTLAGFFRNAGISEAELEFFRNQHPPPTILGINHYLTSNRFLDENLNQYPAPYHGGNEKHRYADVEAVHVGPSRPASRQSLLKEAWDRYGLPIAVTESHLNSTREEQLRWLRDIWDSAAALSDAGVDVRAVTAWGLLGVFDWTSLVTRFNGFYEPGVFDVRSSPPRPTAVANLVKSYAVGEGGVEPLAKLPGTWSRGTRSLYPVPSSEESELETSWLNDQARSLGVRPLLITGARGTLAQAFVRICEARAIPFRVVGRQEMDISDAHQVESMVLQCRPWAIVNAAGYVRVDEAERNFDACYRDNVMGPVVLASACAKNAIPLLTFSSDLVFDGRTRKPYTESSAVHPLNAYGRCKAKAEAMVQAECRSALVVRTSAFFGPWDEFNFLTVQLRRLAAGQEVMAPDDVLVSPTYVPDLVNASLDLLIDREKGIWHLANDGEMTWAGFARLAAGLAGFDPSLVRACRSSGMSWIAKRPAYSVLGSERGKLLPQVEKSVGQYIQEAETVGARAKESLLA